jgi:hypothetical protein
MKIAIDFKNISSETDQITFWVKDRAFNFFESKLKNIPIWVGSEIFLNEEGCYAGSVVLGNINAERIKGKATPKKLYKQIENFI